MTAVFAHSEDPRDESERRVQPAGWGDSGAWRPIEDDLALAAAERKAASS